MAAPDLPPNATIKATPYTISVPDSQLDELQQLLKLSKLAPTTYEGQHRQYGVTNAWMQAAKTQWQTSFDWRAQEAKLNRFPQYLATVQNRDGRDYELHFVGIFSSATDAVPLLLLHGWPGSWIEFQHIIPILQQSTAPAFHIVIPSLPGYGASQQPPVDADFTTRDVTHLINELMVGLGFGGSNGGYYAQGGDIGRRIATKLGQYYSRDCKAIHLNMSTVFQQPPGMSIDDLDDVEKAGMERGLAWMESGRGYALEHGTRPSTIGHALASSPLALLAWLGEKFLDWTDKDPTIDQILEFVTLWWFMETFPKSIYPYRETNPRTNKNKIVDTVEEYSRDPIEIPTGFSWFPKEMVPTPRSWIAASCNLVYFNRHESGGHFAAFEEPEKLAGDIGEWIKIVKA